MKKYLKNILLYIVIIFIFYAIIKFFLEGKTLLEKIEGIDYNYLIPQFILVFFLVLANAYMNNTIVKKGFDVQLTFKEWCGLGFVNTLSNYIFPLKTGTMIKAIYLKNKYNFNISHSASISVFATFISFEIIFFLSAIIFTYIRITKIILFPHLNLFMISSYCVFFLGIVFMYTLNKITIKNNFKNKIVNRIVNILVLFIEGMKSINRKLRLLFVIIVIHIGIFFIQILRLSFAYLAIKTPPTLLKITFINLLNSIAAFIPLTPGNLGIQEFVITFSSQIIGFTKEEGFVAAAIIRIAALSIVVTLGITFSLVLKKGNDY